MDWYVVHVRGGCERVTAARLQQELQLDIYVPEVWRRMGGALCRAPLFRGYIFVTGPDLAAKAAIIDRTPGCGRILHRGPETGELRAAGGEAAGDKETPCVPAAAAAGGCDARHRDDLAILPGDLIEGLQHALVEAEPAEGRARPEGTRRLCRPSASGLAAALVGCQAPAACIARLLQAAGATRTAEAASCGQAPSVRRIRRTRRRARRPA